MNEFLTTGLWNPTGSYQGYIEPGPIADQFWDVADTYVYGIVPVDTESPAPSRTPTATRSYEEPWYVDTINRAIERAAQVATVEAGGYPPYPSYPTPSPAPVPMPAPISGAQPQQSTGGIQLSTNTLMLIVGGFLLFTLGKRGR